MISSTVENFLVLSENKESQYTMKIAYKIVQNSTVNFRQVVRKSWFKLYFNCYKYKHIIAENIKYPGSDKKPKACTKVISWQVDIICKSFINGRRARSIETLQLKVKNI